MTEVNRVLGALADGLVRPLAAQPAALGLAELALLTAVLVLVVTRATSDAVGITAARAGIYAAMLEMRLFNDNLRAIFRAQIDVFRHLAAYWRACLMPVVWLIVPLGLATAQLEAFYGHTGLAVGEPALLTASFAGSASQGPAGPSGGPLRLEAPSGLRVDAAAVWFPDRGEMIWRLTPLARGLYTVTLREGEVSLAKTVTVSEGVARRSPARLPGAVLTSLEYPSEPPLPDGSPVTAIRLTYPDRAVTVAGWSMPWWVYYGGLAIAFAIALRRPFGVML